MEFDAAALQRRRHLLNAAAERTCADDGTGKSRGRSAHEASQYLSEDDVAEGNSKAGNVGDSNISWGRGAPEKRSRALRGGDVANSGGGAGKVLKAKGTIVGTVPSHSRGKANPDGHSAVQRRRDKHKRQFQWMQTEDGAVEVSGVRFAA